MKTIYLFGEVGFEITAESLKKELPKNSLEKVRIIIDSPGGGVSEGIRIHNLIKSYKGDVEIILGAMVASAAAYIAMAVPKEKRKSFENSSMMIHEASSAIRGRARDFKTVYDRLTGLNNIVADSFAADMGKNREQALALMSEDYYMTGWEQLVENNIISDIINPKDVEFPEPTQEDFSWDFFWGQLEKPQDKNIVKEKMYEAEERFIKDLEKNNIDLEKAVALLDVKNQTPIEKPVEDNIITEEKMNLQEFLTSNPEAKAEYDKDLLSAEEKGKESVRAENSNDRIRIANILKAGGITLTENQIEAIESGIDAGEFALAEIERQKNLKPDTSKSPFASIVAKQTPKEQDPEGAENQFDIEKVKNNIKEAMNKIGGI